MNTRDLRTALGLLGALLCAASAGAAGAADPPPAADANARAAAEKLSREAAQLTQKGEHEEACRKLEESDRLAPDSATKFRLAECYDKTARPASAWALYVKVADADKESGRNKQREVDARRRAAALEPKLPRMTIVVPTEVASQPGLTVQRDGVEIGQEGWGTPMPVNPGEHTIRASAPGKRAWERKRTVAKPGESVEVIIPPLLEETPEAPPAPPDEGEGDDEAVGVTRRPRLLLAPPPRAQDDPMRRPLMFVTGGIAVAGLGVGSVFGVLAISRWDDVEEAAQQAGCPNYKGCPQAVADTQKEASSFATVSTFGFIVGSAALAGTLVLWLTAPPEDGPSSRRAVQLAPSVGPGAAGALVRGVF